MDDASPPATAAATTKAPTTSAPSPPVRVFLAGGRMCGKTALLQRLVEGTPVDKTGVLPRMSTEFARTTNPRPYNLVFPSTGETVTLLLSDHRGWSREQVEMYDERIHGRDGYYPSYSGHDVILVCMDLSVSGTVRRKQVGYLEGFVLQDIAREAPRTPLLFVGLKAEAKVEEQAQYVRKTARRFTHRSDRYAECSAVTFEGVLEVFELAVRVARAGGNQKSGGLSSLCKQM
ncbi:hypothetical protein DFJ73DRAFT_807699 [Zopfochytrium polystomum]|nr:hypothetical protein DFJ73DRAFT_807699 [Zopfochytrium polystomum]